MASSGKLDAALPRLTEDNFDQWTVSLRMIALALKAGKFVFPPDILNPSKPNGDEEIRLFYLIANMMLNSIDSKLRSIAIAGAREQDMYPYNIYLQLEKHFNPSTRSNDIQLRRQLYMMRFQGKKSIEEFANDIRITVNKINFIAAKHKVAPIEDREMLAILLMDLPLEFSTEVTLIEREHAMLFDKAVEILRSREQRVSLSLGAGSSSSSSSTNNSSNGSINSAHGEKKRDLFCEYHGKCGHATDQCHKLNGSHPRGGSGRAGRGRGRGQGRTNQRGGRNGNAHSTSDDLPLLMVDDDTCTAPRDEIALNTTKLEGAAIFDSGCSRHVCGRHFREKLIGWHTGPTVSVRVANGKRHTSDQYASLPLTISTDEGPREVIFSEVLYIEVITNLLLLVGVMTQ